MGERILAGGDFHAGFHAGFLRDQIEALWALLKALYRMLVYLYRLLGGAL